MNDVFMIACPLSSYDGGNKLCRWCNEPLEGRRYRWCSEECAQEAVANRWFNTAAHAVRKRDQYRCTKCGTSTGILHAHHIDPARGRHSKSNCIHHQTNLTTLCSTCHKDEHSRLRLIAAGESAALDFSIGSHPIGARTPADAKPLWRADQMAPETTVHPEPLGAH